MTSNEGVFIPPTPRTLNLIDFEDLPKFESLIDEDEVDMIRKRYLFCRGYENQVLDTDNRAHSPPLGVVAIYTDQQESRLRMPTSAFFRSSLRYWATRVTKLTPNAIRVLVSFKLICRLLSIQPSANLFQHFYAINKHDS